MLTRKLNRSRWGESVTAANKKTNTNPAAHNAKVTIRRHVLDAIGPKSAVVFDAFAGDGVMHRGVWHAARGYTGCDLEWYRDDDRRVFVADNRRVMRCVDLAAFTIFDLDAWGSPWEQCIILAARRPVAPRERLGIVLTEGSGLKVKLGQFPTALRIMAGMRDGAAGSSRSLNEIADRAINELCRRMRSRIVKRWQAEGTTGAQMRYIGLVIEGLP